MQQGPGTGASGGGRTSQFIAIAARTLNSPLAQSESIDIRFDRPFIG